MGSGEGWGDPEIICDYHDCIPPCSRSKNHFCRGAVEIGDYVDWQRLSRISPNEAG